MNERVIIMAIIIISNQLKHNNAQLLSWVKLASALFPKDP